jgi:CTP synthase (UTP-ammonia lyase)
MDSSDRKHRISGWDVTGCMILRKDEIPGQFFCNFAVNADYERPLQEAGLHVSARGTAGEMRAIELPNHRFFHAMLFQPQLSSSAQQPHPLIVAYIEACAKIPPQSPTPVGATVLKGSKSRLPRLQS